MLGVLLPVQLLLLVAEMLFSRISPKIVQKQADLVMFLLALKTLACLNLDKRSLYFLVASAISPL